tara:strand:- start:3858 stop:4364 length:507 start_codon:yes stop_codon:yes gene_type:complete
MKDKRVDHVAQQLADNAVEVGKNADRSIITGEARDAALEASGEHLADALKKISVLEEGTVREVLLSHDQALRSQQRCVQEVSDMMKVVVHDIPQLATGMAHIERQMNTLVWKVETALRALTDKELATEEELEKIFKEKVLPEFKAAMEERAAQMKKAQGQAPGMPDQN